MTPAPIAADLCIGQLKAGKKILIAGNGGSAAEASHFAAELVVRYQHDRRALPCIALTADQAILTACANDFGYELVFQRQLEALAQPGDIFIALTTSGRSRNIRLAIHYADAHHIFVLEPEREPDASVDRNQELHLKWLHTVARLIEEAFI